MKTFKYLLVAAVAVPAIAGTAFAQTAKPAAPATPAAPAAATQEAAKPAPAAKNFAGELVSVDQAAKTVTVKHMVDNKATQLTMAVEDGAVASLAQLKPGDQVKVSYVEMGEKRIVKSIVKG
jgi:Cu/Ag efflux protein CusF